jgi:uncharacterized protein
VYELYLFVCAFFAGGINALAGGGTFLAFPALIFAGVPALNANATCTLVMFPGQIASAVAFKADLDAPKNLLWPMGIISLIGGLIGALVMLNTPPGIFAKLVPFLLLTATLIFAFGNKLTGKLVVQKLVTPGSEFEPRLSPGSILFQLLIGIYGGYFGAGMGIVMLALLSILGMTKIHSMNALKTILTSAINLSAAVVFAFSQIVYWREVVVMMVGSITGGYVLAKWGRLLPAPVLRRFIIVVGFTLTVYFFFK